MLIKISLVFKQRLQKKYIIGYNPEKILDDAIKERIDFYLKHQDLYK